MRDSIPRNVPPPERVGTYTPKLPDDHPWKQAWSKSKVPTMLDAAMVGLSWEEANRIFPRKVDPDRPRLDMRLDNATREILNQLTWVYGVNRAEIVRRALQEYYDRRIEGWSASQASSNTESSGSDVPTAETQTINTELTTPSTLTASTTACDAEPAVDSQLRPSSHSHRTLARLDSPNP